MRRANALQKVWAEDETVNISQDMLKDLIETVATRIIDHAEELTDLDKAIGDGDHGLNMKRGFEEVLATLDETANKTPPDALKTIGTTLVMKVGGASGPLYGTFFMALGKAIAADADAAPLAGVFGEAVDAVKKRGKSNAGQKTMLDVLVPVHEALARSDEGDIGRLRGVAHQAAEATVPMLATKGRASFLGERSIGHMDPGARSSALAIEAVCDVLEDRI